MNIMRLIKVTVISLMATYVLILNPIEARAEWKHDSTGWWNTEGNSWSVGWKEIDGYWYYFNSNGYMLHDTTIDGYKLGSDGAWIPSKENLYNENEYEKMAEDYISSKGYRNNN